MSRMGHDPWLEAAVWFAPATDKPWAAGVVRRNHAAPSPSPLQGEQEGSEWVFYIEAVSTPGDDTDAHSAELIEVQTKAVDSFGLEYQLVKKRDKNAELSAAVTDMTALSFLNEPEMIRCLKQRYAAKHIYTNIGPILVAVNPFEQLASDVYSAGAVARYAGADQAGARGLGPHVFQIGHSAYNRMFIDKYDPDKRENQSILVNGESGAGKRLAC
jgi:myosin heavy subunit